MWGGAPVASKNCFRAVTLRIYRNSARFANPFGQKSESAKRTGLRSPAVGGLHPSIQAGAKILQIRIGRMRLTFGISERNKLRSPSVHLHHVGSLPNHIRRFIGCHRRGQSDAVRSQRRKQGAVGKAEFRIVPLLPPQGAFQCAAVAA